MENLKELQENINLRPEKIKIMQDIIFENLLNNRQYIDKINSEIKIEIAINLISNPYESELYNEIDKMFMTHIYNSIKNIATLVVDNKIELAQKELNKTIDNREWLIRNLSAYNNEETINRLIKEIKKQV